MTEQDLKTLIAATEQRFIFYKQQLEQVGRNRDIYPPQDAFVAWYRQMLRDMKNMEESDLKALQKEQQALRQGVNPPFMYRD